MTMGDLQSVPKIAVSYETLMEIGIRSLMKAHDRLPLRLKPLR